MKTTLHNVAEIYELLDQSRARLDATLDQLGPEQETLRDAPERWSVAEIVEHVALVEKQMARLVGMLLAKAESDSAASTAEPPDPDAGPLVSLDEVAERASRERYTSPEVAVPTSGVAVSDSRERLRETRSALGALRPRVEAVNAAAAALATYPHPAFGPLNLYQWLAFVALHEARHRQQIKSVLSAAK